MAKQRTAAAKRIVEDFDPASFTLEEPKKKKKPKKKTPKKKESK